MTTNQFAQDAIQSCNRIQKNTSDELRTYFSLKIMRWKRYHCYTCYWEGSRW